MENRVEFLHFKELLNALENVDTSIRVRMSGEGWIAFSKVILLSESAMILQDGAERRLIMNLRNIVEFELEQPWMNFAAHTPYEIMY